MKKTQTRRTGMALNIIGATALLVAVFGLIVSVLGFASFTAAFKKEYAVSTYHMADTATALVNGDHIDDYLAGRETEEYRRTAAALDEYCHRMRVSLLYVIKVDTSDYGRFVSVFNLVDNSVDDTEYTPWELGHRRDTTNDDYRRRYRTLYEQGEPYETVYRQKTNDGSHPHITTMVPVKNSAGDVVSILCVQRPFRELNNARLPYLRNIALSTILLGLIASAFAAVFIRKHVVAPLQKVADEAARFAVENTKGEKLGDISRYRELADLAEAIDTMETDMVSYIETLTEATAARERIETELALANRIQAAMLPHNFPAFPDRPEFDVYGTMDPAREVGGDFFDFFLIDDDHLCLVIADVSGKGVPAALFMMVSKIILQSCAMLGRSPSEILTKTNEAICSNNQAEMFVTVWVGILEISTGILTASNAGHEYPVLKRHDGVFELLKGRHGFVVGGMDDVEYKSYQLPLQPGSKLFVYTDGVPEATDADNNMFGTDRMIAALNSAADESPEAVLKAVRAAVDEFTGDAEQFDDLTMMCLEYTGPSDARDKKEVREHD